MQSTLPQNNQRKRSFIGSLAVSIMLLALSLFITFNRQLLTDALHFWTYHPTSQMKSVTSRAAFTDSGLFTFYAVQPEIATGEQFNSKCNQREEGTAILGCYVNDRIYLFDVTDERLDGIKEVTAAHEMLHAVYQRLSDDERTKVNALVEKEYEKLQSNPSFAERMAFYARTEPGERDNELHSIIGTEVGSISSELERHYAKYFKNRKAILALFDGYNSVFLDLDKQAKALSAQLDTLSKKIDADMLSYGSDVKELNADIEAFNRRAESGGFATITAFNVERKKLQNRLAAVTSLRAEINTDIERYNALRKEYNQSVTESNNLYKSIDSTLAPAPQV